MVTKQQLAEAERLQEQMRDILIVHLDDYEHSMIQLWKKRDILKDSSNNNRQTSLKFNAEVAGVVESFKKRIQTFRDEQALLDHDIRKLKETATSYSRQKAAGTIHRWSNQSNRCYSVVVGGGR